MNSQGQFKITNNKGCCFKPKAKSFKELTEMWKRQELQKLKQVKVMHSNWLCSIDGIQKCEEVVHLNLASNKIESIFEVKNLVHLQVLDVKTNRISSLQGIQYCLNLVKLDASHNLINNLDAFTSLNPNNRIQFINLAGNRLANLQHLKCLSKINHLIELYFEKGKASNPFCQNKHQYHAIIKANIEKVLLKLEKFDDKNKQQISLFLQEQSESKSISKDIPSQIISVEEVDPPEFEKRSQQFQRNYHNPQLQTYNFPAQHSYSKTVTNQQLLAATQRQRSMEEVIYFKQQIIEELRSKNIQLQMSNSQNYKDLIKKQAQQERLYGQVTQLAKNIDSKDAKINELHRRLEELLKTNSNNSTLIQHKSQDIQQARKEIQNAKLEAAEYKMLAKDQERRLSELQNKSLQNMEEKVIKNEQLRRRYEDILMQNKETKKEVQEYKDRVREMAQLLREWQFKYEHKVKELETYHHNEKNELIRQYEHKIQQIEQTANHSKEKLNHSIKNSIEELELKYKQELTYLNQKYKLNVKAYQDKCASEKELRVIAKTVTEKNRNQEHIIKEFQDILQRMKKQFHQYEHSIQEITNQNHLIKNNFTQKIKIYQNQLGKLAFEKNNFEKIAKDLKTTNQVLQNDAQKFYQREKQNTELHDRVQHLNTALDAKNVMLDDKNETIESLKSEIESIQRNHQNTVEIEKYEELQKKYNKNKEKIKQMNSQLQDLITQNETLKEQNSQNNQILEEFAEIKEIIDRQQSDIQQKDKNIHDLLEALKEMKRLHDLHQEQIQQFGRENGRLNIEISEKQKRFARHLKEKEDQYVRQINEVSKEMESYKEIAVKFKSLANLTNRLPI